jgi:hypothetical protein
MNVIMEYNCDYRRYTQATSAQVVGKKPRFFKSPESADETFFTSSDKALVVVHVVSTQISCGQTCYKDWDTEYYPTYIIVLHN